MCAGGMLAQAFMDYSLNGAVGERIGNRSGDGFAPYNLYPAKPRGGGDGTSGDDRWISISVMNNDQWQGLKTAMGDPEWAANPAYATNDGRRAAQDQIDAQIAAWTVAWDDYELFHHLQAQGVPAAPVLDSSRVMDDPHVQARGLNTEWTLHDGVGPYRFNTPFYRFSETPVDAHKAPAALGEDNDYVYCDVLGYSDAEGGGIRGARAYRDGLRPGDSLIEQLTNA